MASNSTSNPISSETTSRFNPDRWGPENPNDQLCLTNLMRKWEEKMLAYEKRTGQKFTLEEVRFAREMEIVRIGGDD
jgi:hypothetical protein